MLTQNKSIVLMILVAFTPITLASELGKTIVMQGNSSGAMACSICHGANGAGQAQAGFPHLAGLNSAYMQKQLHDFTTAQRHNPIMTPIATALSADEVSAVSNYFAQQSTSGMKPTVVDESLISAGQQLAQNGNWTNDVPACFSCHGAQAKGIGTHFPALAGQHASYIEQQLNSWRSGQRSNDPNQLMVGIAQRLSETEIKAVSAYLANLTATDN
ncbi:c-type cytochrome [Amphritea sp.]|uniref:c-type cytochrome n=1 Tax=Amphritea sp. TaxID=1872502 RepID=UPI003A8D9BF8